MLPQPTKQNLTLDAVAGSKLAVTVERHGGGCPRTPCMDDESLRCSFTDCARRYKFEPPDSSCEGKSHGNICFKPDSLHAKVHSACDCQADCVHVPSLACPTVNLLPICQTFTDAIPILVGSYQVGAYLESYILQIHACMCDVNDDRRYMYMDD